MAQHEKRNYRIILVQDNKEIGTLGTYVRRDKAQIAFKRMIDENANVLFPIKYVNTQKIKDVTYKIVLIKKKERETELPTKLQNEYGEFVEHNTNSKNWYIFDIHSYQQEEKFWVYGYHPKKDRKEFKWVYNNIVKPKASNKYTFLNITLYLNKVLIESGESFDMVICKNKSDAIRMYNLIEEFVNNDKLKYIIFSGDGGSTRKRATKVIERIMENTGWNRRKCTRHCTRP